MSVTLVWNAPEVIAELERRAQELARQGGEYMLSRYQTYAPVDTGRMVASAGVENEQVGGLSTSTVVVTAPYAAAVELGHFSVAGTWVSPHPALSLARDDAALQLPAIASRIRESSTSTTRATS